MIFKVNLSVHHRGIFYVTLLVYKSFGVLVCEEGRIGHILITNELISS